MDRWTNDTGGGGDGDDDDYGRTHCTGRADVVGGSGRLWQWLAGRSVGLRALVCGCELVVRTTTRYTGVMMRRTGTRLTGWFGSVGRLVAGDDDAMRSGDYCRSQRVGFSSKLTI